MIIREVPVKLPESLPNVPGNPLFLHFFKGSDPLASHYLEQFRTIATTYGEDITCLIIVPENVSSMTGKHAAALQALEQYVVIDAEYEIFKNCGVYSSQAVVIDHQGYLFYRGNYRSQKYANHSYWTPQEAVESVLLAMPFA